MKNRKIECIKRMLDMAQNLGDLVDFLFNERLITRSDVELVRQETDKARTIYELLIKAKQADKILLLDFEWSILPVERISINVVTENVARSFTYNS